MGLAIGIGISPIFGGVAGYVPGSAAWALNQAKTRPIDIVDISDSVELYNGYGWNGALNKAFANDSSFGVWATAMLPEESSGTQYSLQGWRDFSVSAAVGATSGADVSFDDKRLPVAPYLYTASGAIGNTNGLTLQTAGEIDINANLRYDVYYGTFNTGSGSFRLRCRQEVSPNTIQSLTNSSVISTNTGALGEAHTYADLAAATRDFNVGFKLQLPPSNPATVGPTVFLAHRVQELTKTKGVSIHSVYGESGQSMYDAALYFQDTISDARQMWVFGKLREEQIRRGQTPVIVVRICFGFNDRNETGVPTRGPAAIATANASKTQAGYADNLRGLIYQIEAAYTAQGWSTSELYFWIVTPYPITSGDADLAPFRAGADEVAAESLRYDHFNYASYVTYSYASSRLVDTVHPTDAGADDFVAFEKAAVS